MSRLRSGFLATALAAAMGGAPAYAQDFIEEVRLGVLDHDTGLVGTSKEDGADLSLELLSHPLSSLSAINSPRLVVGGLVNSEGQTNQLWGGLVARWDFAEDVMRADDAFFLEGMVGVAYNDGQIDVTGTPEESEWKSHGSHWGFRTGFSIGYQINDRWSAALAFHHMSNADLADPNEGANDVGLRIGLRL